MDDPKAYDNVYNLYGAPLSHCAHGLVHTFIDVYFKTFAHQLLQTSWKVLCQLC